MELDHPIYRQALASRPTDFSAMFICPVCHRFYSSQAEARECFATTDEFEFAPGDIVRIRQGYGWFEAGRDHWVLKDQGYPFHGKPTHDFLYVVTSIDVGNRKQSSYHHHRPLYSVKSLATNQTQGWTAMRGHYTPQAFPNPPQQVIDESRQFIGQIYHSLL